MPYAPSTTNSSDALHDDGFCSSSPSRSATSVETIPGPASSRKHYQLHNNEYRTGG
ncbi:hypothetical protein K439DRAFT_1637074 [Ramaria rubella]|nr:hypothetical protein K439DRAFT_1637074 [Ramaria rubella]